MQYALVDGERRLASPESSSAVCCLCEGPVRPKCGSRIVWHWAHHARPHCDTWWEPESEWHRAWKAHFPESWREQVQFDPLTGEKHIADVRTASSTAIEFQNSPMTPEELASREAVYGTMVWVVNGLSFKSSFNILGALPDPSCEFARDLCFFPQRVGFLGRGFWRKSENPNTGPRDLVRIHSVDKIAEQVRANHIGHHLFDWRRPRSVWYLSSKPVYFDFHGPEVWELQKYDERGLMAVKRHDKMTFVSSLGGA